MREEEQRTNNNWGNLCHLAYVVVRLHDALYSGDRKVHGDVDVGRRVGSAFFPLHLLAPRLLGRELRGVVLRHVLCILHALLAAHASRHAQPSVGCGWLWRG